MTYQPLVSVIITTYNRSSYLEETLASINDQNYHNLEILVVDDGSKPNIAKENKAICENFSSCVYYYKPNTGQPDSRNFGIQRAKGTYIAFCDDDDYWLPKKLEKQVNVLNEHPDIGLVTGNIEFVGIDGQRTGRVIHQKGNHGHVFEKFILKNRTSSITPMLRKEVFDTVGYFNPDFVIFEDWEFWRRVAYYYPFYALDEVLACVRLHDSNTSNIVTTKPVEQYQRFKKLNKATLAWGVGIFSDADKKMIEKMTWKRYQQILRNHCPGFWKKLQFFLQIAAKSPSNAFEFIYLMYTYGLSKR